MTEQFCKNPKYNSYGTIDCEINHPVYGWITFTASPDDVEEHGRALFAELVAGTHGAIAEYVAPVVTDEQLATQTRNKRDLLLVKLDTIVTNPLRWAAMTTDQQTAVAEYRKHLLDVPQQSGFPAEVEWPVKPEFLL